MENIVAKNSIQGNIKPRKKNLSTTTKTVVVTLFIKNISKQDH